jgi:hypothetical protein
MALIKGIKSNHAQASGSIEKSFNRGSFFSEGLTVAQKNEQRRQKGMNPNEIYSNFPSRKRN